MEKEKNYFEKREEKEKEVKTNRDPVCEVEW